jgi:hypothetical protein
MMVDMISSRYDWVGSRAVGGVASTSAARLFFRLYKPFYQ